MKKGFFAAIIAIFLLSLTSGLVFADKPVIFDPQGNEISWSHTNACTTIQSGLIVDSAGNPLTVGYDEFGYNYQAHMFNGTYDSADRQLDGKYGGATGDYVDDTLMMKWSDEWLANVDCNGDGKLDRGLVNGVPSGTSYGWTTNHVEGEYVDADGNLQHYTYFTKIVWVVAGGGLWGAYDVVEEIYNDPTGHYHVLYADPGLGHQFYP